jgi:hypothetical protein
MDGETFCVALLHWRDASKRDHEVAQARNSKRFADPTGPGAALMFNCFILVGAQGLEPWTR